jgi:hypothetical protein
MKHRGYLAYDRVWEEFCRRFNFNPRVDSGDGPGLIEPFPSITYNIHKYLNREENFVNSVNQELQEYFKRYFQRLVQEDDWIIALNWQHECYRFYPHIPFDLEQWDETTSGIIQHNSNWPVPILPMGDYHIFLEKNFQFGVFGHPWQRTICIFGERLLTELKNNKPACFDKVLRTNCIQKSG